MEDDKFDFSALDPARDPRRWEQLIEEVTAHAIAPTPTISLQLVRWGVLLAVAAMVAMAVSVPLLLQSESRADAAQWSAPTLADWANRDQVPANVDLLELAEGSADER